MNLVTYADIKNANDAIKTTDIKGKAYAEVNQRIKAFRMLYPTGTILTELVSNENGVCVMRATVGFYDENGNLQILGQGTAYEKEDSTFINRTSFIENAETSSVGRALGMAGLGIDTSVASAEEVQNAIANQGEKTDPKWIKAIDSECKRTGVDKKTVFEKKGVVDESRMTRAQFDSITRSFEKTPDKA